MSRLEGAYEQTADRLNGIDRRFDAVDRRFDAVDRRFDALDAKIDNRFIWTMGTVLGTWLTMILAVLGFGFEIIQRLPAR